MRTVLTVVLSGLVLAACGRDGGVAGNGPSAGDGAASSDAEDCMPAVHPGTITFVDGDTGAVVSVTPIADVPESLRYRTTSAGRVPVVKAVKTTAPGGFTEINLYGPCGQWLEVVLGQTSDGG